MEVDDDRSFFLLFVFVCADYISVYLGSVVVEAFTANPNLLDLCCVKVWLMPF